VTESMFRLLSKEGGFCLTTLRDTLEGGVVPEARRDPALRFHSTQSASLCATTVTNLYEGEPGALLCKLGREGPLPSCPRPALLRVSLMNRPAASPEKPSSWLRGHREKGRQRGGCETRATDPL
jgi:hypothetical protein